MLDSDWSEVYTVLMVLIYYVIVAIVTARLQGLVKTLNVCMISDLVMGRSFRGQ